MTEETVRNDTGVRPRFLSGLTLKVLIIGLAIRFVLMPLLTYPFDVEHWAIIIQNIESGNGLFGLTGYFYTPVWGYILGFITVCLNGLTSLDLFGLRFTDLLGIETLHDTFFTATTTTPLFNVAMKIPLVICDVLVGYLVYRMVLNRTGDAQKAGIGFGLWFLCPLVIYMSAVQVQFDCLSALFALLSILLLKHDRCFLAGTIFVLGSLIKMFPAFLVLLFVAYLLRTHRDDGQALKKLLLAVAGALLMLVLIFLPQLLDGTFMNNFSFITDRASSTATTTSHILTYGGAAIAFVVMIFLAVRLYRLTAEEAQRQFYKYALFTLAAAVLIAIGPQYCIVFLPLLAYYIAAEDPGYRRCLLFIGVFGLAVAWVNNSFSLLTSAGEFWGWWDADWIVGLMQAFETRLAGITLASWMIAIFTVLEYLGIIMALAFAWTDAARRPCFNPLKQFILGVKNYHVHRHTEEKSDE